MAMGCRQEDKKNIAAVDNETGICKRRGMIIFVF
jgi:hypothetical protein